MNRPRRIARMYLAQRPAIDQERAAYRNRREARRRKGTPAPAARPRQDNQ